MGKREVLCTVVLMCLSDVGAGAGEITGSVRLSVTERPAKPRRYYKGPFRSGRGIEQRPATAADAVVWAEGATLSEPLPKPQVMRQKNETFIPNVLAITVGSGVVFPNEDDFYHNVFSYWAGDRFDLGRYAAGEEKVWVFEESGVVNVRCQIHAGMKAYIVVLKTPYFTMPDPDGDFVLSDLPAGEYTVKAWHPGAGEQSRSVRIPRDGMVEVNFGF